MSVKVKVSPRIVSNIARLYESTSRIFMEYIDNSLDSAEKLYEANGNKYPYKIEIVVNIDPVSKTVTFSDNCIGMDLENLLRVVENIGDSNKKNDFVTNGQFGFGIHSYAACANRIEVTTLQKTSVSANRITIDRSAYTEDGQIPDPQVVSRTKLNQQSGTIVKFSGFDKDWWKEISPIQLKKEIEQHFEQLLSRDNLEVKVIYGNEEEVCSSFNYDNFLGVKIEKEISSFTTRSGTSTFPVALKIDLRITEDIIPDKRPIFINKGRRIEEIQAIKSFRNKSKFRTGLWGHKNLTGYIEVSGLLAPKLSRDDFEQGAKRQMVYEAILEVEDEIHEALQDINKRSESANMSKLEDLLSDALSKLARQDYLRFRTTINKGSDINLLEVDEADQATKKGQFGKGKGKKKKPGSPVPVVETLDDSELKGSEGKKSGFNVEFSDREQKTADGVMLRSDFIEGGAIVIYKSHPDFKERVKRTYQGDLKITERLVSYLASEIAIQYKDKFFAVRGKQPEVQAMLNSRKEQFVNLVDFSYQFEEILMPFVGKNLLTLESVGDTEGDDEE